MKDAMQKIFVLGDVDVKQSGEGTSYGVTSALAKSTNYKQLHGLFVPGRISAEFVSSKNKFLLLKGYSQKEDGIIRISENSMVRELAFSFKFILYHMFMSSAIIYTSIYN